MTKQKICFIQACWHKEIVDELKKSFLESMNAKVADLEIDLYEVPGSLEIPLQAQLCLEMGGYDLAVVAGLVVDGGIYRHDFVAASVLHSVMEIQLRLRKPIVYAVLTPHHFRAESHENYFREHFKIKGSEAAQACIRTLENLGRIKERFR